MKTILKVVVVRIITWQAKLVLKKYNPKIIAVTGSVGKTSTKDAIYHAISHWSFTRKSEKSFNSEIGVPLTILGVPNGWSNPITWIRNIFEGLELILLPNNYPKWLVLEIGADRPGDIESITKWLKPDISVITRLSKVPVHVEYFQSVGELIREKSFLVQSTKIDGFVILNSDDEDVLNFANLVENKKFSYGTSSDADILGKKYKISYERSLPVGIQFEVMNGEVVETVSLTGVLGVQQMYPVLAALAVGQALGLPLTDLAKVFDTYEIAPGRMKLIKGVKDSIIIVDTYNSSPVALFEALNTLKGLKTKGRKFALLGDMLELGSYSGDEHKKAGMEASTSCDFLVTVGIRSRLIVEGALNAGMPESNILQFDDSRSAGKYMETVVAKGDVVLAKGSQGMRMEKAVEEIMAEPQEKEMLLVRQDTEWNNR
jgi:UDP-N-acetylmuramoyl-tripeptide--D-alanyl-D-alanine ligase